MKIELYPFEIAEAVREFITKKYAIDLEKYEGVEMYTTIRFDNPGDKSEYLEHRDGDNSISIGVGSTSCWKASTTFEAYLGDIKKLDTTKPIGISKKKVTKKKVTKKKVTKKKK